MEEVSRRVRQPNRRYDEPGSANKFRTGTFLVIKDSIDGELQKRRVAHTGIGKRFGFLQKLKDLLDDQVITSAQSLQEPYTRVLKPICLTSCCSLLVFLIWNQLRNHWMDATACPATPAASPAPALVETCAAGNVAVVTKVDEDVILNVERGLRGRKLRTTWRQSMRIGSFAN